MNFAIGITLAVVCAIATQLGFLYKHRGANDAPDVDVCHPLRSAAGLLRAKWFAIGLGVAAAAWIAHVAALAFAPLSVVQAVLSTGVVTLAVLADKVFGFQVSRRQWLGVVLTAIGLLLLGVTVPHTGGSHSRFSMAGMIAFESAVLVVGLLLVAGPRIMGAPARHHGLMLGAAAGLLFGVSDVAIKGLLGLWPDLAFGVFLTPWFFIAVLASVVAFFASAKGLQEGEAVPVILATSTAANVATIAGGIIVFNDPMAGDALGIVVQAFAFTMVIAAALLVPPPMRAANAAAAPA